MELMQGFVIAVCVFVLGRVVWGFISAGRVEKKAVYMTHEDCKQNRENMCIGKTALAEYTGKTDVILAEHEKRLNHASSDFDSMRNDIKEMSIAIAELTVIFKSKVEKIIVKE